MYFVESNLKFNLAVQSTLLNSFIRVHIESQIQVIACIELYISTPFDLDLKIVTQVTL